MTPNDVKIVADNIDDFIEVPDGVGRLRKAVLTLAVSGKLVQQDKGEGTADDLCRKIQEESVKQISGRRKKDFSTSPIDVGETSFERFSVAVLIVFILEPSLAVFSSDILARTILGLKLLVSIPMSPITLLMRAS